MSGKRYHEKLPNAGTSKIYEHSAKVELWLSFDNVTKLALSIPLAKCGSFSVNPLKWLRFLGFAIYGQEGYLFTSKGGPRD